MDQLKVDLQASLTRGYFTFDWSCDTCGRKSGCILAVPPGEARLMMLQAIENDPETFEVYAREAMAEACGWYLEDLPDDGQVLLCPGCRSSM